MRTLYLHRSIPVLVRFGNKSAWFDWVVACGPCGVRFKSFWVQVIFCSVVLGCVGLGGGGLHLGMVIFRKQFQVSLGLGVAFFGIRFIFWVSPEET